MAERSPESPYDSIRRPNRGGTTYGQGDDQEDGDDALISQPLLGEDLLPSPPNMCRSVIEWDLKPRASSSLDEEDDHDNDAEAALAPGEAAGSSRLKVTLDSLRSMTPFESEADAYIQSSLDELDPTPAVFVLPGINPKNRPDEPSPFANEKPPSTPDNSGSEGRGRRSAVDDDNRHPTTYHLPCFATTSQQSSHPRTAISAAEELYHLTTSMLKLDCTAHRSGGDSQPHQQPHRERADSAVDNLTLAAHRLHVRRNFNSTAVHGAEEEGVNRSDDDRALKKRLDFLTQLGQDSAKRGVSAQKAVTRALVSEYQSFDDWVRVKRLGVRKFFKYAFFLSILPGIVVAAILFYFAGNPPCSQELQCSPRPTDNPALDYLGSASASWWILFICCRQMPLLVLAWAINDILVDYVALRTNWSVRICGPLMTLFIIQAKGWPCLVFFWGVLDLIFLFGKHNFAQHWLFYQDFVLLFNAENPSGKIPDSEQYQFLVIAAMCLAVLAGVKRIWLGIVLGRVTYQRYSDDLAKVMSRALLVGKTATLAREIERSKVRFGALDLPYYDVDQNGSEMSSRIANKENPDPSAAAVFAGVDDSARKGRIDELLGEWEEPEAQRAIEESPSIASVIQFRQSTAYLNSPFPFGASFGSALTRQEVLESAEALYNSLMKSTPDRQCLTLDVLALLAVQRDGTLETSLLKDLIKFFRPDRNGNISLLEFAKSIDTCYKDIRLLRANIRNSSQLDKAFERIVNAVFYIVIFYILLGLIGVDPRIMFASITSFVISLKFMIGTGCAAYFEGIMMVFWQRPYDIGDRIATSYPYLDTSTTGSSDWVVQDFNLYSTTVVYGSTNEVATHANGALSTLRIINATRSPQASISFHLKFAVDTPYAKIMIFKSAVEKFIRARPREWVRFSSFRVSAVEASLGYVDYSVGAVHRDSWNNSAALSNAKADLQSFANELSKKMNMRYVAPPKPVTCLLPSYQTPMPDPPRPDDLGHQHATLAQESGLDRGVDNVAQEVAAMFGTALSP